MGDTTTKMTTTKSYVITKKDLAIMLNCVSPSGIIYYKKLRNNFFNKEILLHLEITEERWKQIGRGSFSIEESKRIVAYHNLQQEIEETIL